MTAIESLRPSLHAASPRERRAARAQRVRPALSFATGALAALPLLSGLLGAPAGEPPARLASTQVAVPRGSAPAQPAWLDVGGVLRARAAAQLAAPRAGVIAEVHARPGELVQAGQLLARLDARALRSALRALLAESAARSGAGHERAARTRRIAELRGQIARAELRAPLQGVVSERWARPGARVAAGEPLFHIVAPDGFELSALLPEHELPALRRGQRAWLRVQGFGADLFGASVEDIGAAEEPGTGAIRVRLRLDPSPAGLLPGLLARGQLQRAARTELGRGERAPVPLARRAGPPLHSSPGAPSELAGTLVSELG